MIRSTKIQIKSNMNESESQQQRGPPVVFRRFFDDVPPPYQQQQQQQTDQQPVIQPQMSNLIQKNASFMKQLMSSKQHLTQEQQEQQQRYMQNYLNQSLKDESVIKGTNPQPPNIQTNIRRSQHSSVDQQQRRTPVNQLPSNSVSRVQHNQSALSLTHPDPRKNDTKFACLIVKKAEFFCTKENLQAHSNYLQRVFEKQEFSQDERERNSQVKIRLPESTKGDVLIMFLDYIDKGKELPNRLNLYIAQNILLIAESLKMRQIQKKFLLEIIMPMLNRENVIFFTKMSYNKLTAQKQEEGKMIDEDLESQTSHQDEEGFWLEFFSYCLDYAASNIQYLLKKRGNELMTVLEASIIEEIIERGIKFYRTDLTYDNTVLFDTLMKVRKCESIFQLLEQERVKIIEGEGAIVKEQNDTGVNPTLTWNIQNLSGNFYKESDPFMVESAQWRLSVSYFKMEEESLSVQIKMVTNPFEVKKSKDYFKKKEFFLPSNVAGGLANQANLLLEGAIDEENLTQEEIQKRRKLLEQANAEYPSHAFITIVSSTRINKGEPLSEPQVHTLICSAKTPALIGKFADFRIEDYNNLLTVEIYFKVKYIYSAILLYISRNFTYLITDPMISMLPKDQFKLLLKHKMLNVTQEDEVVKGICMWAEGQEMRQSLDKDISELLENINWNYVTLPCLLDLIRNFAYVRRNPSFHKIINKEFTLRQRFNAETSNLEAPRYSYKYNKTQNIQSAAKQGKSGKSALLYINHENFFQNLIDSLLEPVDLIKAHLVNEGINESSHRKQLELQLLQKKREIAQIEEQLANMRLMDDMSRDRSRPNSILKGNPNTQNKHNLTIQEYGDDVETIKNSMINLLNVVVEGGENSQEQARQQTTGQPRNLIELSQEAIQKMQNQSIQQETEQVRSNHAGKNGQFEQMYEDLENIAQNNKIQIMFKTQDEAFPDPNEEDDESQESQEEERKSVLYSEGNVGGGKNGRSSEMQQRRPSSQLSHGDVRGVSQTQQKPPFKRSGTTSNSSQIIFGGGSLVSPKHHVNHQYPQILEKRKNTLQRADIAIQTSIQNMNNKSINLDQSKVILQQVKDQSIQMTFEEPPEDFIHDAQASMLKDYNDEEDHLATPPDHDNEEEKDYLQQHFISNEASSLQVEAAAACQEDEKSIQSLHGALSGERKHEPTPSEIEYEDRQRQVEMDRQYQIEQLKIRYQNKLMQEYTQIVQKMTQDVFDQNFLKNFQQMSSPTHNNNGPAQENGIPVYYKRPQNQIQVQNPKVQNLNISIHNNANYVQPQALDNLPQTNFTPLNYSKVQSPHDHLPPSLIASPTSQHQTALTTATNSHQKQPQHHQQQYYTTHHQQQLHANVKNIPIKGSQYKSTQQNNRMIASQNEQRKGIGAPSNQQNGGGKPKSAGGVVNNNRRPPNMNLQIDSSHEHTTTLRSGNVSGNMAEVALNVSTQKAIASQGRPPTLFGTGKPQPMRSSLPITMPNSVKNANSIQPQKFVKQNIIQNKSQNKLILGHLLSDTQQIPEMQNLITQNEENQHLMTLDPPPMDKVTTPLQGPHYNPAAGGQVRHQKSLSHGIPPQFQWTVGNEQSLGNQKTTDKQQNENLQNEIIRMIVEEMPVQTPQNQFQQVHQPKLQQNWMQPGQNNSGFTNFMVQGGSFGNKRTSLPITAMPGFVGNFNILDELKLQTQQAGFNSVKASSYQNTLTHPTPTNIHQHEKPQNVIGFGSLATHHQKTQSSNIVLDLGKLKVAAKNQGPPTHLGTIEESKMNNQDSDSQVAAQFRQSMQQSDYAGSLQNSRSGSQTAQVENRMRSGSLQNRQNISQQSQTAYVAYSRCQPHEFEDSM